MAWEGWDHHIGCDRCRLPHLQTTGTRYLPGIHGCWGRRKCHGFANHCGCHDCSDKRREIGRRCEADADDVQRNFEEVCR